MTQRQSLLTNKDRATWTWRKFWQTFILGASLIGLYLLIQPAKAEHTTETCYTTEQAKVSFNKISGTAIYEPNQDFQTFFLKEMKQRFPNWIIKPHQFDNSLIAYVTDGVPFTTPSGFVEVIVYYYKDGCLLQNYIGKIRLKTFEQVKML